MVIGENWARRRAHAQATKARARQPNERLQEVFLAAQEARRPLLYGQLIIMIVYLPIFALSGVEGRMFQPMALTVLLALLGALLLTLTFVPAALALFIGKQVQERENVLLRWARQLYQPALELALRHSHRVLAGALLSVLAALWLASRLGSEFAPHLNEGDFALQVIRVPGASLSQSLAMQQQLESRLKQRFPEIDRVFARTGTAEIAADPMPPNISDAYLMLKPESAWPQPRRSRAALMAALQAELALIPGQNYELSQPIQLRFNELISGVRADLAVKIFGDDMVQLQAAAQRAAALLGQLPGASEVNIEQTDGLPLLQVEIRREQAARYGLNVQDVQETLAAAVGGREAGQLFEGERRFNIVLRLPENLRNDPQALRRLPLALPRTGDSAQGAARFISLGEIADIQISSGPNQISRENGKRRIVVSANVRGRDLGSFVAAAQHSLQSNLQLPPGYWLGWGGQYENLQAASARLQIVAPLALLLVLVLLLMVFGNLKDGLLVFTGIPFALSGGVLALWLRAMPLSISAGVGFIALSGVAVLNGLVMLSFIRQLRSEGMPLEAAIRHGALARLRPVLMTALVASLGFIPMALASGTGAEVQRPLATVVIGGILSSTTLTLLLLPLLYRSAHRRSAQPAPEV